jgi:hypothetical protein
MIWDGLKKLLGARPTERPRPKVNVAWIEASDNPWGVRVLDVRPVTLTMISVSEDPRCAENAVSYGKEDGSRFARELPEVKRTIELNLRFRIDRLLPDGVLFTPGQMEHKWALFVARGQLIIVRSWRRQVFALVELEQNGDHVVLRSLRGALLGDGEPADLTERMVDFLLRSHVLKLPYPAPLPPGMSEAPETAALWCMNTYGNLASFATEEPLARVEPAKPLRSHSLLHINVARGDTAAVQRCLQQGIPIDLLAGDGLAPLHWAIAEKSGKTLELLLDSGSPVDVRSDEGSTALMLAVQARCLQQARLLLDRGADVNAADARGFTSLHRAAEMGQLELAKLLMTHGASPHAAAGEHTPLSLARARGEQAMEALLVSSK